MSPELLQQHLHTVSGLSSELTKAKEAHCPAASSNLLGASAGGHYPRFVYVYVRFRKG